MSDFTIEVVGDWLGGTANAIDATFGSLRITAQGIPLTEVDDTLAKTTRTTIRVPAISIAEWLVARWWRLRWESRPERPGRAFRRAHSMAALDSDIPCPPLEIASDGEFVQLVMPEEPTADVAAIRYLRSVQLDVPAAEFESGVEKFLDLVDGRVGLVASDDTRLRELRAELRDERSDPALAQRCRWQARAGIDAGDADDTWMIGIERVARKAGAAATEEFLAGAGPSATPEGVEDLLAALKRARTKIDLDGVRSVALADKRGRVAPWARGTTAARLARTAHASRRSHGHLRAKGTLTASTRNPTKAQCKLSAIVRGGSA